MISKIASVWRRASSSCRRNDPLRASEFFVASMSPLDRSRDTFSREPRPRRVAAIGWPWTAERYVDHAPKRWREVLIRFRLSFEDGVNSRLSTFFPISAGDAHCADNLPVKHEGKRSRLREIAHESGCQVLTAADDLVRF